MVLTPLFLLFCVAAVFRILWRWGARRGRAVLPLGICLSFILLSPEVGGFIRRYRFARSLTGYERVIHDLESGSIPVSGELQRIPTAEAHFGHPVLARLGADKVLMVEFLIGGGFPVKHSGYLYSSSTAFESDPVVVRRWPKRRKIQESWYWVSD
jgi:hypothetical protein